MKLRRLRSGERLALVGAVLLAVVLGLNWFLISTPDARVGAHESGIRSLGWFASLLVLLAVVSGIAMAVTAMTQRATALPIITAVLAVVFGLLAALAIAVRLVAQPALGVGAGNGDVEVALPAYLGLLSALAIAVGAWLATADERTESADSRAQTEDVLRVRGAPRPAPPATAPGGPGRGDAMADPAQR